MSDAVSTPLPASAFETELSSLLRANYSIVYVTTHEEQRALRSIGRCAAEAQSYVWTWSVSRGLLDQEGKPVGERSQEPVAMLQYAMAAPPSGIIVLQDFHHFLRSAHGGQLSPQQVVGLRVLRDMAVDFRTTSKTLLILAPLLEIPPDIEKDVHVLDLPLPTAPDLAELSGALLEQAHGVGQLSGELPTEIVEQLPRAMSGLTLGEAENALVRTILGRGELSTQTVADIVGEKEQVIRKSGVLEFYSSPELFGNIGGLNLLKTWLRQRALAFTDQARDFGLPEPTGLLLVGVPGCGKSLCAKAVAQEWQMPLLRFDLGKVFARYVGQAEENMRRALSVAEGVAPAVLWMDEIEKGLAGAGGDGDRGVATRVFGTLLTWMQEKTSPVFVVATANDVTGLAPELLRRFDDLFFVDLPHARERAEVFRIHLLKRERDPDSFDLGALAEAAGSFSGAEIEQVVIDALYRAFDAGELLEDEHVLSAIRATRPLAVQRKQQIDDLRAWAADRCRFASAPESEASAVSIPSSGEVPRVQGSRFDRARTSPSPGSPPGSGGSH
jgi:hypothetical protein